MVQVKLFSVLVLCFSLSVHGVPDWLNSYIRYVKEDRQDGYSSFGPAYSKIDCTGNSISSSFTSTSQECVDLCNEYSNTAGLPCTAVKYFSESNLCQLLSEYNCENKYTIYEVGSFRPYNITFHDAYCEDEKRPACGYYETLAGIQYIQYIDERGERKFTSRGPGFSKIACTGNVLSSFSSVTDTSLECRDLCLVQNVNVTHNNATGLPCTAVRYFSESNLCQLLSEYNCENKYAIYESSATVSDETFHNAYCEDQKRATCGHYYYYNE